MTAKYWVVIPAGGSGQRMQADVPKQYLKISDRTILEHTLTLFLKRNDTQSVVVCVAKDDEYWPTLECSSAPSVIVADGGATRAQSVLNGLTSLSGVAGDQDWVLVHDAARPCLSDSTLQKLINTLQHDDIGGILAIRAKDTLKQSSVVKSVGSDDGNYVQSTLDRSTVWQAQTPQMFRYKLLKETLAKAISLNVEITDESSAIEWAGFNPRLVEGDGTNLKITTPEDLEFAKYVLAQK